MIGPSEVAELVRAHRQSDQDAGALTGGGVELEPATHRLGALPHDAQSEAPRALPGLLSGALEADAVVFASPGTNAYTPEDELFMINGIEPRDPGCWQATATYKGATLQYVYSVPGGSS